MKPTKTTDTEKMSEAAFSDVSGCLQSSKLLKKEQSNHELKLRNEERLVLHTILLNPVSVQRALNHLKTIRL